MPGEVGKEKDTWKTFFALASIELFIVQVSGFALINGIFESLGQFPFVAKWGLQVQFYIFVGVIILLVLLWFIDLQAESDVTKSLMLAVCEALSTASLSIFLIIFTLAYESAYDTNVSDMTMGNFTGTIALGCTLGFLLVLVLLTTYVSLNAVRPGNMGYAFMSPEGLCTASVLIGITVSRTGICDVGNVTAMGFLLLLAMIASKLSGWIAYVSIIGVTCTSGVLAGKGMAAIVVAITAILAITMKLTITRKVDGKTGEGQRGSSGASAYVPVQIVNREAKDGIVWRMPLSQRHKKFP